MSWNAALLGISLMLQSGPPVGIGELQLRANQTPDELEGVGITEHVEARVPGDVALTRYDGTPTTLGDVLNHDRPVILTFNYSSCPMLCSLQLDDLVNALSQVSYTMGEDYDVVTISVDPNEKPERASGTREAYLERFEGKRTDDAWTFLVGDEAAVKRVADTVGFGYAFNPDNGEWLHTATLILLNGDEQVSRYIYGVNTSPKTLQLSIAEASEGKFVSAADQLILYCFQYDPTTGTYTPMIANIMRLGGGLTALVVLGLVMRVVLRSRREEEEAGRHDGDLPPTGGGDADGSDRPSSQRPSPHPTNQPELGASARAATAVSSSTPHPEPST
ncbi:MAG: SCO family protein [Myxococcota bacterium]